MSVLILGRFLSQHHLPAILTVLLLYGCAGHEPKSGDDELWQGTHQPLIRRVGNLIKSSASGVQLGADDRYYLIRDLGTTRDPAAYSVLVSILRDRDFNQFEKDYAAISLAQIGDARAMDVLAAAASSGAISEHASIRAFGILAYYSGSEESLAIVLKATEPDRDLQIRLISVSALRTNIGVNDKDRGILHAEQAGVCLEMLVRNDPSMLVRVRSACALLADHRESHWSFLAKAIKDADPGVRQEIAERIPFRDRAVPLLLELLGDEDDGVASAAYELLYKNLHNAPEMPSRHSEQYDLEANREAWRLAARAHFDRLSDK